MRALCMFLVAVTSAACASAPSPNAPVGLSGDASQASESLLKSRPFSFDSLDERPVSSSAFAGKPAVIAFVSTGDIVSQAQMGFLVPMSKKDGARIQYAAVALHPRKESVLVESWRSMLGVEFPVALADSTVTGSGGPFGEIPAVPTIVILDAQGRIVWKHTGLAKSDELRARMRKL